MKYKLVKEKKNASEKNKGVISLRGHVGREMYDPKNDTDVTLWGDIWGEEDDEWAEKARKLLSVE